MPSFWEQQWHQFIFQLANYGHIVFLGTLGIGVFGLGPIGRAISARIRYGPSRALPPDDPAMQAIRAALDETLERLDFSERVLMEMNTRTGGPKIEPVQTRTPRSTTPS